MRFINILGICAFGAAAQQISFGTPPFYLSNETLSVDYGNVSVSPPGRVLPLSGKLVHLHAVHVNRFLQKHPTSFASFHSNTSDRETASDVKSINLVPVQSPRIRIRAGRITGPPFLLLVVRSHHHQPYLSTRNHLK